MSALVPASRTTQTITRLHAMFLLMLPRIEQHAQIYFRHIRCPQRKDDAVAEALALSWKWVIGLTRRGKDPRNFVSAIASFAARAVKSGRRLCGQEKPKDVLSPRAQRLRGFAVGSLPSFSTLHPTPLSEALADNTRTPPDEQAAFRCDFPLWLSSLDDRRRRIVEDLMMGERTLDVAGKHGVSSARVSQMRREFEQDWSRFHGDDVSSGIVPATSVG